MRALRDEKADLRRWKAESEYFKRVKSALLKKPKFRNKFVAVKGKSVVDVDADKFELFHRMHERFPDEVFLIVKVQKEEPVLEVPSVEIVH